MTNVRFYIIMGALLAVLAGTIITGARTDSSFKLVSTELHNMEGRISLQEGKAVLTNGDVCIIKNEALLDEELALNLTRACVLAYQDKVFNTPAE